jgi:uncharacterized protein
MRTTEGSSASVAVEFDVPTAMRDGVVLRANLYRPDGDGPWPTLLARLPYGKDEPALMSWLNPMKAAREGFMVVVQDTRGRCASEGEWSPLRFEREDGYDSVEWAARLPGSNGRVGMYGASYWGNSQWMAAVEQPPSLAAISPALTWSEPLDGLFARGGALELGLALPWTLQMGAGELARLPISEHEQQRRLASLLDDYDRLAEDGYHDLPVADLAVLRRHQVPDLGTIRMLRDADVATWSRVAGRHDRVTVPSLHIAGWYDAFVQGTLDNYAAMAAQGRASRLVVGPWAHDVKLADPIGERCFGIRSSAFGVPSHQQGDLNDLQLAWFRHHLMHDAADDPTATETPVRIFVMGRNEWRDETSWPPQRTRVERWFLGPGGTLGPEAASSKDEVTEFIYDPAAPVPTRGGNTVMAPAFLPGAFDQTQLEARPDVLVFTSEPVREELEVTGRVRVVLHAESSATSTDWVARLCDVDPDGRSFNICDGIVRVTQDADSCARVDIDLWSTSNVFLRGHRLRVHVTSSSFPRWDRNLNTGNQDDSRFEVAHQRVYHNSQRASWIELPVMTS